MNAKILLSVGLFAAAVSAQAGVTIGNGNYFVGFVDLEHEAPLNSFQLKALRSYNSRSQYDGMFGYGWGSEYEAFLLPSADGSIVIQESGGGDKTRFNPEKFSKADLEAHVDRLLAEYGKKEKVAASRLKEIRQKVLADSTERDELSRTLGIFPELPVGTKLYTTQRGEKQTVTVIKGGFVREYADGRQELFNVKLNVADKGVEANKQRILKGVLKMSRMVDPVKKSQIFFDYDKDGHLATVTDKKTQTMKLIYNSIGKVAEVRDAKGRKATYVYCEAKENYDNAKKCGPGDLIAGTDTAGGLYTYHYDNVHNLIQIGYPDKTTEDVTFWPSNSEALGGVKSVKNQSGQLTEYKYSRDPKDKDGHYKTEVKTTYTNGQTSDNSYEYYEKARADGSKYRYKLLAVVDGEKTDTIYNECCGQPLQIIDAVGTTKFEYYAGSGLPREKDSPGENVQWQYHPKFHGKITKVVVNDKITKTVRSSEFQYEEVNGQLQKARTSDGKGIALFYDAKSRISMMVDQDKRKITFKYGDSSKPIEIVQEGVGAITVTYDKAGNIKDVKSKGGRQIAISVAAAFQNLLEIIKPAGIQPI